MPGYSGYVAQSTDGSFICVGFTNADNASERVGCSTTAIAEQQGIVVTFGGEEFVALVPAGGSADLTTNGTTTAVPIDDGGIATGTVDQAATLTVTVGSSVTKTQLGPNVDQLPAGPPTGATS
jgi:hypothetical protein